MEGIRYLLGNTSKGLGKRLHKMVFLWEKTSLVGRDGIFWCLNDIGGDAFFL